MESRSESWAKGITEGERGGGKLGKRETLPCPDAQREITGSPLGEPLGLLVCD